MISIRIQVKIALSFFLIAALLGVVLRWFPVIEIPANFRYLVHTHSHIALLGWVYLAITTLLYKLFLGEQQLEKKYRRIFWFTWATLVGMLLTFPLWGYAPLSIFYSTAFLVASYWFTWFFFKYTPAALKSSYSFKLIHAALWFMVLSSLGPWALGLIMNTIGSESVWYRLAIYFFLHFQYNGWMPLALVGLLFFVFHRQQLPVAEKPFKCLYWLLMTGIMLSYFLSTLWTKPGSLPYILGGFGASCQLLAFAWLTVICIYARSKLRSLFSNLQWGMLLLVTSLLIIKMVLQLLTAFPYFADLAATVLDFTIGYLHLTFLGVVSIALFLFMDCFRLFLISKTGYIIYLLGFLISEALIFYKGISMWQQWPPVPGYFEMLALTSLLIPLGLITMLVFSDRST